MALRAFLLGSIIAACLHPAAHAARAVMEGIQATNNTVFVSTPDSRVGLGDATPDATLDVTPTTGTTYAVRVSSNDATDIFTILHNGKIGVNTTTPTQSFHVRDVGSNNGTLALGNLSGGPVSNILTDGTLNIYLDWSSDGFADMNVTNFAGHPLLTVNENRNVSIGDSTPGAVLEINPSGTITNNYILAISSQDGTVGAHMVVRGDGKVGISSTTPTDTLSVHGTINANAYKVGTTAGVTKTCTASQYLDAQTTINGITTGGTCTAVGGGSTWVLIASGTFSAVTVATITLTSTATYSNFHIVFNAQNVNASARSFLVYVGSNSTSNHGWSAALAASNATNAATGCPESAGAAALSYTAGNATNIGASAYVPLTMQVRYMTAGTVMATWENGGRVGALGSIFGRNYGSFIYTASAVADYNTLTFYMGTTTSCTVSTPSANSLSGTFWAWALPN